MGLTIPAYIIATLRKIQSPPVILAVANSAARKTLATYASSPVIDKTRVVQDDLPGILWTLVALPVTEDASWIGVRYYPVEAGIPKITGLKGVEITDADTWLTSAHEDKYLSFTAEGAKTYLVVLSDGFEDWEVVTLRNSAGSGNLTVSCDFGVTLHGDQNKLLIAPGGILQLVKAGAALWHIL